MTVEGSQQSSASPPLARPPLAGWGAAILLLPHVVLGAWLTGVPDYLAFTVSQVVVLVHVLLAFGTLPLIALWAWRHATRMKTPRSRATASSAVARWVLAGTVLVAVVSGYVVIWGGDIISTHLVHATCGVAVAAALAWHLWQGALRGWAVAVTLLLVVSIAGSRVIRAELPPKALDPLVPEFAFTLHPTDRYEPSAWCGECHVQDYAEWSRSTHGRTLTMDEVRKRIQEFEGSSGNDFNLVDIGRIIKGENVPHADKAIEFNCASCHAPARFYGDERRPLLTVRSGPVTEGVSCAVCHTMREVMDGGLPTHSEKLRTSGTFDVPAVMSKVPFLVSSPESVRRYIGQGSTNPVAHQVALWLIRWRPEVHSHDYHSPVLDTSRSCMACHSMGGLDGAPESPHKTYVSWRDSAFNTGDPKTTVTCQDCHMVTRMTGQPVVEARPMVPWGPDRTPGRSHLLVGGNVEGSMDLHDPKYTRLEHELNTRAVTLTITGWTRQGDTLDVKVAARNDLAGHYLPAMETHMRYLWIEVSAIDAAGRALVTTTPPKESEDFESQSPMIFRCTEQPKPECDTLIAPLQTREYVAHLRLPADAHPARIDVALHTSVDRDVIAHASRPFTVLSQR